MENETFSRGWGSWTGKGMVDDEKRRAEKKQKKIEELKKKRRDSKFTNVIISEKQDKLYTKYMLPTLPHPYESVKQYEAKMSVPVGKEWNTYLSFKKMIAPEVIKNNGEIIRPLKYKKVVNRSSLMRS